MGRMRSEQLDDGPLNYAGKAAAAPFFAGSGEMSARLRAHDWSKTSLGPVERWSTALRTLINIMLANRFPMLLWWGSESISLYNDAYIPVLGCKHPAALGLPVRECWAEIYDVLRPLILTPLNGGPATWSEDLELEIRRHGFLEETHWTVAYSPVPDDTAPNGIGGVLATVHEITAQVVADRRGALLRDLGALLAEAKTAEDACTIAAEVFARHAKDVPFASIYLIDPTDHKAHLAGAAGLDHVARTSPPEVDLANECDGAWSIARVARTRTPQLVEGVNTARGASLSLPQRALVMPLEPTRQLAGVMVVGLSPLLELDASHRGFVELATTQLSKAIANARAYETERRRAEALTELDRAKTAFFSNVSHELRTPPTLMFGPVQDMLQDASHPPSASRREQLETVHRNALRLLKLVNSLLDFSRIEAGRVRASFEATDVSGLTAELASSFRSLIERAGVALHIHCPPLREPLFVDRQMWEKIVLNLLSNAFKFTFEGEISVRIELDERELHLKVSDTGTGIEAKHLPHLFERFYRVEGARGRTYEGTGIGLALVRELAKIHGGRVSVQSRSGEGSTFVVSLLRGTAHLPKDKLQAERTLASTAVAATTYLDEAAGWLGAEPAFDPTDLVREPPRSADDRQSAGTVVQASVLELAGDRPLEPAHILVADDNADMRAYLTRLLRPLGTVEAVADGRHALAAIARRLPDLVLSDVMMPNLDGVGLLRALRADEPTRTLPIVLISARAGEEARVEGASAGADDYIVKPFAARELVARIRSQLQLARLRREHAEALVKSEERFRALVMASSDVVYRMSPDWSEMLYLRGRDFLPDTENPSRTWLEQYIHPDDQSRVTSVIQEAIRNQSTFELEHRVRRVDGSVGWTFSRAIPLRDAQGKIVEWFGTASDITVRRQAEEALRRANLDLAQADVRKNEFLALLSHELRNPLAPITNSVYLLEHAAPGTLEAKRALAVIDRQSKQLSHLVDDLLDLTRISRGKIVLQRKRVELNEIVRRTVDDQRSLFEQAGVHVELRLAPKPVFVDADSHRLAQAIGNVLQNAAKFTGEAGQVRASVSASADTASITIADTGVGIAPEVLAHLFEPFVQADRTRDRSKGGLGLGLALVKGIIELHDGDVLARSEGFGRGSQFVLHLPLAVAGVAGTEPERTSVGRRGRRVLLIEDNVDAAETLGEVLGLLGHDVAIAFSGPDGLAMAREHRPDVVLCDIGLPVMNGLEVARAFRADAALSHIFLVALSGYALPEDIQRAMDAGFHSHLAKPADLAKLKRVLDDAAREPARAGAR
jgi:signal transduction histidine kinase